MTKRLPSKCGSENSGEESKNYPVKADSGSRPRQYSVLEASKFLELHSSTIYTLVAERLIQHQRKGPKKGRLFFLEEDLQDYLMGSTKKMKVDGRVKNLFSCGIKIDTRQIFIKGHHSR